MKTILSAYGFGPTIKKLSVLGMIITVTLGVAAQVPQKISYQAVIRNISGQLVINQPVGLRITILQGTAEGIEVYAETQTPSTNANGLLTTEFGGGTGFGSIDWAAGPFFLRTEVDPLGGCEYSISGTSELLSVPFAKYAETAGNGFTGDYNDLTNKPVGNNVGDMLFWNGTGWITIEAGTPGQVLRIDDSGQPAWEDESNLFSPFTPSVTILDPTACTTTSVTLNASVNPNEFITNVIYEYGPTTAYGSTAIPAGNPFSGNTPADVSVEITGLSEGQSYHYRVLATNLFGTKASSDMIFTTDPLTISDVDGNSYDVVRIGTQLWTTANLRVTKFNDGSGIPNVTGYSTWVGLTTPGYCWYNNNEAVSNGALYNWYAVNAGNLCPAGWHVPSAADWSVLGEYAGGNSVAGEKLKATTGWPGEGNGTDEFGFRAIPNGNRYALDGVFYNGLFYGYWWSSDASGDINAMAVSMSDSDTWAPPAGYPVKNGFSVRCVKY